jgi:hypothetical protein
MPRFTIRDAFGMGYELSSKDPELIQRWFDEWLPKLYPADAPEDYGDPVMMVWPLPEADGRSLDWAAKSPHIQDMFRIPRDPAKALAAIEDRRKWIEAQP